VVQGGRAKAVKIPVAIQLFLGLILSTLIGYLGYRRQSLSKSGVLGAILVGTTIFGLGGWAWGVLLVVFFVSSSALSQFKASRKAVLAEKFSKGSQRDLGQALANGGAGVILALTNVLISSPWWWVAFAAAMATVNADTWATELGVLSSTRPRLVTTGIPVEAGTSGAISNTGILAALAGSALIGVIAGLFDLGQGFERIGIGMLGSALLVMLIVSLAGLFGSLFDSWLGATVQAIYFCEACGKETERHPIHTCGRPTRLVRGWRWLDNDWVNFLSSVTGAVVAVSMIIGVGWRTILEH
jgi:uncharacterized protein (TIGR00297 family)